MQEEGTNCIEQGANSLLLRELIVDFLRELRFVQGLARSTHKSYQSQLRRFERWLGNRLERPPLLADVSGPLLRAYIRELSEGGRRPRTVRAAVIPVRSLFNYLVETRGLVSSPVHAVRLPKKDAAQRPHVSDAELGALVEGCDRMADPVRSLMARALLLVLITTGVRRSELLDLKISDVHREEARLLITRGKGSKSRAIPLTEETLAALKAWLEIRPACRHEYLFIVDTNSRLGHTGLDSLLDQVKAAAGLRHHANIQPHSIRHAAASRILQRGGDLKSIQTMLGHSNISTTAVYLHVDEEHLRSVVQLASLKPGHSPSGQEETAAPEPPHARSEPASIPGQEARPGSSAGQGQGRKEAKRSNQPAPPERAAAARVRRQVGEALAPSPSETGKRESEPQPAVGKRRSFPRRLPWALARRARPPTGSDPGR